MSKRILVACPVCYTQFGVESEQTEAQDATITQLRRELEQAKLQKEIDNPSYFQMLADCRALAEALQKYANKYNWTQKDGRTGTFDWFMLGYSGWDIADKALIETGAKYLDPAVTGEGG